MRNARNDTRSRSEVKTGKEEEEKKEEKERRDETHDEIAIATNRKKCRCASTGMSG